MACPALQASALTPHQTHQLTEVGFGAWGNGGEMGGKLGAKWDEIPIFTVPFSPVFRRWKTFTPQFPL